jgi:hypothetical protein
MKRVLVIVCFLFVSTGVAQQKPKPTPTPTPSKGVPTIRVWVDTEFGYYHCPTSKLYGKTKQGVYMTQKQAQDRGYRPAYGTFCTTVPKAPPKTPK